jgi:cell division protein ZapA
VDEGVVATTIHLIGKEYRITCPEHEQPSLLAAAEYLDTRMKEIRDRGKALGGERIAIMAALNIAHELLQYKAQTEQNTQLVSRQIQALQEKIGAALSKERMAEAGEH